MNIIPTGQELTEATGIIITMVFAIGIGVWLLKRKINGQRMLG